MSFGEALRNPEFESGDLSGWSVRANQMGVGVATNLTFNRNYSACIDGTYSAADWITNSVRQVVSASAGDSLKLHGFVYWRSYAEETAAADGYVEVSMTGPFGCRSLVWDDPQATWTFASLTGSIFGVAQGDFETGTLAGWQKSLEGLAAHVTTNHASSGRYALRVYGSWSNWSFNRVYQRVNVSSGDVLEARGRIYIADLQTTTNWVLAGLKIEKDGGPYQERLYGPSDPKNQWLDLSTTLAITEPGEYIFELVVMGGSEGAASADVYFDQVGLRKSGDVPGYVAFTLGANDDSDLEFLQSGFPSVAVNLDTQTVADFPKELNDSWWPATYFGFTADADQAARDLVTTLRPAWSDGSGTLTVALDVWVGSDWQEAGRADISGTSDGEITADACWIAEGRNDFRLRTVTGNGDTHVLTWDQVLVESEGVENPTYDVTVEVAYHGWSGGASYESAAEVYADGFTLFGSTALVGSPESILDVLRAEAAAIATNPAVPIPPLRYPDYFDFGYPGGDSTNMNYPSCVESVFEGWRFRRFTNDVVLTVTNLLYLYELPGEGPGYIEFDQYAYVDKNWGTERGAPVDVDTNAPFFTIGTKDGSGAEFGAGPFGPVHTYVVGSPLENFPRRMSTSGEDGWPKELRIVFGQNFGEHSLGRDLYCVLATCPTAGPSSNLKLARFALSLSDSVAGTNLVVESQEMHMGWATEAESRGMIDYPNCTYQDHNHVGVRNGSQYNLADDGSGWFCTQSPRSSVAIEPMTLYMYRDGSWLQRIYEEYLYTWPSAASGVRSIFDDDSQIRLDGHVCYDISYKLGHAWGTNEFGETQYWQLFEGRGNGYFRMTDYSGIMAGSFRTLAADIFSLYGAEDQFMIPQTYARIVPRTTPTNEADDSYVQSFMQVRSKTNQAFIGVMKTDFHYSPDEVGHDGAYFDLSADVWANRAWPAAANGRLCLFDQASMHWRGDTNYNINALTEAHDIDVVMVHKTNGEWISHQVLCPPSDVVHRRISDFEKGDVAYIQQQDRGLYSFGFIPEAPYQRACSFEITLLQHPGRDISLDVYEEHTENEFNDNIGIACSVNDDLAEGDRLSYAFRYRAEYSPTITIVAPNETSGEENWTGNVYTVEFNATDGDVTLGTFNPLHVNLFYGSGRDGDWQAINTGGPIVLGGDEHAGSYAWDVSGVSPGAYYVMGTVARTNGGKEGFDVSNTRLQVGGTRAFPRNGSSTSVVTVTGNPYLGNDMGFESGSKAGWNTNRMVWNEQADHLDISVTNLHVSEGSYSLRMAGLWSSWSWNAVHQEIPCVSGETLRVSARLYVDAFERGSSQSIQLGMRMESTNAVNRTQDGVEFVNLVQLGRWIDLSFERVPTVTGTEKLILYVNGNDCSAADVHFDDVQVVSTNTGSIAVNRIQHQYWVGESPADVTGTDVLRLWASGTNNTAAVKIWATDDAGRSNEVALADWAGPLVSALQPVDIPWSAFTNLDRSRLTAIGFTPNETDVTDVDLSRLRAVRDPVRVAAQVLGAPALDLEDAPLFNPGETVTNVVTIENPSASALSSVTVQLVQEYAETRMWLDDSPAADSAILSAATRRGDRLGGDFEQVWPGVSIPAGGSVALTNVYVLPPGHHVHYIDPAGIANRDFYVDRNFEARGRTHLVIRDAAGGTVYDNDQVNVFSMDDDFDIDNDGLADEWETEYFDDRLAAEPDGDPDDDGFSNLDEQEAGTDPTDPDSHPTSVFTLAITGTPGEYDSPEPYGYGLHTVLSNQMVSVEVSSLAEEAVDERYNSRGWTGTGSVPEEGNVSHVGFILLTNSTLNWLWEPEYALTQWALLYAVDTNTVAHSPSALRRDGAPFGNFGASAAADGLYAAIGVDGPDGAHVYRRSGDAWIPNAKLVGSDTTYGDRLGAVDVDGGRVIAGCWEDDDRGSESGSAYIFERAGLAWAQSVKLLGADTVAADNFGCAVAIAADRALVGARGPYHGSHPGAAYVFCFTNSSWVQEAKLAALDGTPLNEFGDAVAFDGDRAVVGAWGDDSVASNGGAVYVFRRSDTNWTQEARFSNPDPADGDEFGRSVSLDGDIIVVGAPGDDKAGIDAGAAYAYSLRGNGWVRTAELKAGAVSGGSLFGESVSLKGAHAVVGAPGDGDAGAAYVFRRRGRLWTMETRLQAADGEAGDGYGAAVALDTVGALVGAPQSGGIGAVYPCDLWQMIPLARTWGATNAVAGTVGAAPCYTNDAGTVFSFVEWRLDGVPQAGNPLTGITMSAPHAAVAVYECALDAVGIVLGAADQADSEFLQPPFPEAPVDLESATAANFPKELNDSWWPATYLRLPANAAQRALPLVFLLSPAWSDGSATLTAAVDCWDGTNWIEAGRANLNAAMDGEVMLASNVLAVGTNDLRIRAVTGNGDTHTVTWDQVVIESGTVRDDLLIVLGAENQSDADFLQGSFPGYAIDLDTSTSAAFPKELNDSWWPAQYFYFQLNSAQADKDLVFTLKPYWSDGASNLTVALDIWDGTDWRQVGSADISASRNGQIIMASPWTPVGRNDFRLRTLHGNGDTHALTWDQIVIESRIPAGTVSLVLGYPDLSDAEFLQASFPGGAIDLNATLVSGFPKELNDSWWPAQYVHFMLSGEQAAKDLSFLLNPFWNNGTGALRVAVDVWNGADWELVGSAAVCASVDGRIPVSSNQLVTGRNDFRFRTLGGTNGTTAVTWDQIVIMSDTLWSSDSDSDGMPDAWELAYQLAPNLDDADADADGDGAPNRNEYTAGTDPGDASALFVGRDSRGATPDEWILSWPSAQGRTYTVFQSTNFANGFSVLATNIAATVPVNSYSVPASGIGRGYYRVEAAIRP